ncbi:15953_t:CDS:2 [Cetraspora pellucida]|uniref:15953_t:CDS:1 n=1 Tax=Cetraspora pellucida TaxID=1433469 RepID=A0A9N9HT58_9GLOM|nr:15953_t:CDS:2 [Cetraspora pellucida]
MPQYMLYQYIERLVREKTIRLIDYDEFNQIQGEPEGPGDRKKRLWNNSLVNLCLLEDLDKCDDSIVMRLLTELKPLRHNNVLRVFGITFDGKSYYFVREYYTMDLRSYFSQMRANSTPLSWDDKIALVRQVTDGLQYLHDQNILPSELHPRNIVMCEGIPKLTNLRMPQARARGDFSFSKYSPPEVLLSHEPENKKKLNIYSLGVLMWEISNDGVEPFNDDRTIALAINIIKAVRPTCAKILGELRNISLTDITDTYNVDKAYNTAGFQALRPKPKAIDLDLSLDYSALLRQKKMKAAFVDFFALNKGRNLNDFDFNRAEGMALDDNGDIKILKSESNSPVVYNSLTTDSVWSNLRIAGLFANSRDNKELNNDDNQIQVHVPVSTVEYTSTASNKFIRDIESALEISDKTEKVKMLEKYFNYYGNYVVRKFTLGGVITVRNWKTASNKEKSYLRNYLQWAIDCGKGKASEIFEDVPLDNIPPLQADGEMDTLGDLYNWFKSLYNFDFAKVIAYGKIIPSYKLLPNNLQEKLFEVTGGNPVNTPDGELIPNVPISYKKKELSAWIALKPSLELFLLDFIHNNSLQYGVVLQKSDIGHGKKAAFKFVKVPAVTEIKKITLRLIEPQNRQEAYLLENGIIWKDNGNLTLENIPFAEYSSILHHPLEDFKSAKNQPSQAIYVQIIIHMAKLSFSLTDIRSLQEYSNSVNTALLSNEPFKNLCKIFGDDYGHLLAGTLTVGGILSKKCVPRTKQNIPGRQIQFEYELDDPQIIEKINFQLKSWENEFEVNTSFLIDNNGDVVSRNGIKPWIEDFHYINAVQNWCIVAYEDWTPLYKLLRRTSANIDNTFGHYQIVFNGEEFFQVDDQSTFVIRFPGSLNDTNYHIFGAVVKKGENGDWRKYQHPDLSVRFDHQNKSSCAAYIYKSKNFNIRLNKEETKLLWLVLADPKGFCSNKNRNVKVLYGNIPVNETPLEVCLKCRELTTDCVLITSIVSKDESAFYTIKPKAWAKARIYLEITKDLLNLDLEKFDERTVQENTVLKWCVIYTDKRKPMVSDANNLRTHSWNSFGDHLDDGIERLEEEDEEERIDVLSEMIFEDAIQQHNLPDGNMLEAWKTFIHCARKGNQDALYWIGFYLQYDILNASKHFLRRFYDDAVDEFAEGAETYLQAAMMLYKKSADAEYHEAQLRYGFSLYSGQGVPQNKEEAIRYFRSAAINKNHTAMYNLGTILLLSGNDQNKAEGEKWLIDAARNNHQKAIGICKAHNIAF